MEKKKYGLGIASFILGISAFVLCCLSIGFIPGIIGLILGIIGCCQKDQSKGLCIAGIVLSIIATLFSFLMLFGILSLGSENKTSSSEKESDNVAKEEIVYEQITTDYLIDILEENPLKAEKTYNDCYLEITGTLSVVDSDGEYISLGRNDGEFTLNNITCYVTDESQLDRIMEMSMDNTVIIRVKITDIGEIVGYNADIIEILE